jgi:glucose/arabinose dehydrogenase
MLLAGVLGAQGAQAGLAGLTRVASGLAAPIFVTHAPGDRERLFIVERGGGIRILNLTTGSLVSTPFLSISGVNTSGEGGLLGLAFHPDYATNGKFYVNLTANNTVSGTAFSTYIREYTVSANPNVANTTFNRVLDFTQPQSNHNGGWIGFSPKDGYLYIAAGDGGNGNDQGSGHIEPGGNAQNLTTVLGKMLRIDVNGDDFGGDATKNYANPSTNPFVGKDGLDEIWAYGLRNPFRSSFDRATGDLWIGDVGQGQREEINFQAANFAGGANYGWRLREGSIQTPGTIGGPIPPGYVAPVYDYGRDTGSFGGTVVTGGYVYRGPDPTLQGKYFFLDSRNTAATSDDRYWMFDPANPYGTVANINALLTPNVGSAQFPASFGEDAIGNLYITFISSGEVYRINTNAFQTGDFDGDADVDGDDLLRWTAGHGMTAGATRAQGDADGDGDVDGDDLLAWQRHVGWSPLNVGSPAGAVPEPAGTVLLLGLGAATAARRRGAWRRWEQRPR